MFKLANKFFYIFMLTLGLSLAMPAAHFDGMQTQAQTKTTVKKKSRNIFQIIFGKKKKAEPKKTRTAKRKVRSSSNKAAASVAKAENAQKILVMGDFIATGLAQGLETAYRDNPNVVVVRQTKGSSTIVKPEFYDWNVKAGEWIAEHKPDLVVFNIGASDRQDFKLDGKWVKFDEDLWWTEYRKKVVTLANTLRSQNVNFLWVGVPSFKYTKMTADILAFNGIYREEVEKVGGVFVDIWDGFVDENGKFIYTGSDINGQQVRLRSSDGINLTSAGRRKLAFYVEKPAARFLGDSFNPLLSGYDNLNQTIVSSPIRVQDPRLAKRTKVFSFTDPELDGGDLLLGGNVQKVSYKKKSPLDVLIETGQMGTAPVGRVDNFAWNATVNEPLRLTTQALPTPSWPKQVNPELPSYRDILVK